MSRSQLRFSAAKMTLSGHIAAEDAFAAESAGGI
jgi:hypothetical protein